MITKVKNCLKNNIHAITLLVFSVVLSSLFFYSHGNISTDSGREAMIPLAILNGEILYKDILNIYAPLSYYINAVFMAIFGIRLESLYIAGALTTFISTIILFKITQKFLDKTIAFYLTLFVVTVCFYNSSLFNYIMPYAYAVTYALCFTFCSLFFILKFLENNDNKYLYVSAVLSGAAFACKAEYIGIALITLFVAMHKTKEAKATIKTIATICVIPLLSYLLPFIQGMSIFEGIEAFKIFIKEATVPSMQIFSKNVGTIFTPMDVSIWIQGTIFLTIFLTIGIFLCKKAKNPFLYVITLLVASIFHYILHGEIHFSPIAIVLTAYFIINFKRLLREEKTLILLLTGLLTSLKTFYNTDLTMYGVFTLPLLFIAAIVIIKNDFLDVIEQKTNISFKTLLVFLLLSATISNLSYAIIKKNFYSNPIKTERGRIDTTEAWQKETEKLFSYLEKNTNKEDKILFLPEGAMFNFLSGHPTDMRMYVLDMPFIETLGEDKITEGLTQYEYIAIIDGFGLYNFDNPRYYFKQNETTNKIRENFSVIYYEKTETTEIILLKNQMIRR